MIAFTRGHDDPLPQGTDLPAWGSALLRVWRAPQRSLTGGPVTARRGLRS
jgi:hypothetical protein